MTEATRQKLEDSLIDHFEFDEGSGLDTFGSHANVNARLDGLSGSSNPVKWGAPIIGDASIEYNDAFGAQCCSTTIAAAEPFSLQSRSGWGSVWIQTGGDHTSTRSDVRKVICNSGDQFFLNFYDSVIKSGNTNPAPGAVRIRMEDEANNGFDVTSDPIPLNEPVMVTWSWDRDANSVKLWVNKTLEGDASSPLSAPVTLLAHASLKWIGPLNPVAGLPPVFEGKVDNSIFGTGTLEQEDVDWLYNEGEGRAYSQMLAPDPPTPEEIWLARFAEASGRLGYISALLNAGDAQRMINHAVSLWAGKPGAWKGTPKLYRVPVDHIGYGELHRVVVGKEVEVKVDQPGLENGKRLLILDIDATTRPGPADLLCIGWDSDD